MITFIYGLKDPNTNEIVYVGQTKDNLSHYLKSKYWKLNEVKRGERNWNKLFKYLDNLLPNTPTLEILYKCDSKKPFDNPDLMEKLFINKYKKINPNLLNETDGGVGGNTYKYKSSKEISEIGIKISNELKGRKKPKGFSEHLSEIRKGKNNPMAKKQKIGMFKGFNLIKTFNYGFEINEYFNSKYAYSNVVKVLKGKLSYQPYGYYWRYLKLLRYSQAYIEIYKIMQGSTYDTVFVDLEDMIYDKYHNIYTNTDELLRRLYVACSRTSHNLILGI